MKANSTLTSLQVGRNGIKEEGALAIAEGLAVNVSLLSLNIQLDYLGKGGALAIAEALKFNPTLSRLIVHEKLKIFFDDLSNASVNTQHNLKGVIKLLVDADGAQVLASKFCMKFPVVTVETRDYDSFYVFLG